MSMACPGGVVGAASQSAALDTSRITTAGATLTEAEQRGLTSDLQDTLEGTL